MYNPALFEITDHTALLEFIKQHNLGMMISLQDGVMQSDHLPFYVTLQDDQPKLIAHFAKSNPLAQHLSDDPEVLVVFRGEHGYISPNWYPTKQIHHRHVPTFNYQVVQIHGTAQLINDRKFITRAVGTLTNIHEASEPTPWAIKDAPKDYLHDQLDQILGLQIDITDMQGKFKLSQNREQIDFDHVITTLRAHDQHALAQAIADTRRKR